MTWRRAVAKGSLGALAAHSRPHVSDDHPYSEAQFKTLKYRPDFPDRFGSLEDGRAFTKAFFDWYNFDHRHSGLNLYAPASVHFHFGSTRTSDACGRRRRGTVGPERDLDALASGS